MKSAIKSIGHRLQHKVLPRMLLWWGATPLNAGGKLVLLASVLAGSLVTGVKVLAVSAPGGLLALPGTHWWPNRRQRVPGILKS